MIKLNVYLALYCMLIAGILSVGGHWVLSILIAILGLVFASLDSILKEIKEDKHVDKKENS